MRERRGEVTSPLQRALIRPVGFIEIDPKVLQIPLHGLILHTDLDHFGMFKLP